MVAVANRNEIYSPKKMYKFKIKDRELKFDRNCQMKYHIEKNTVQETLVIPVYGRKMCTELLIQGIRKNKPFLCLE